MNRIIISFFISLIFSCAIANAIEIQDSYRPLYNAGKGVFNKSLGVDNSILATSLFSHALIYYYIFFFPILILLFKSEKIRKILILIYLTFLIIFVGLRYEIGGDWVNYIESAQDLLEPNFHLKISRDISWDILGYISIHIGSGVLFINCIVAIIFFVCLHKYLKTLPYYLIILTICFPFLVYNFAIGYSRQSVAFAFGLLAILAIRDKKIYSCFFYIVIAASFHKTGLFFFILYFSKLSDKFTPKSIIKILIFIILLTALYFLLLADKITWLYDYYFGSKNYFVSSGSVYRTAITLFAALIYLFMVKKNISKVEDRKIYFIFAIAGIIIFLLHFKFSTFADRINYYLIPLQLFTFAHLIAQTPKFINKATLSTAMVFSYFAILFVQTNFSNDRPNYIPYRSWLTNNCERLTPFPSMFNPNRLLLYSKFCHEQDLVVKRAKTYRSVPFDKLEFYVGHKIGNSVKNK